MDNPMSKLPVKLQKGIDAVKKLIEKARVDFDFGRFSLMKLATIENHWKMAQRLHETLWSTSNEDYDLDGFLEQESKINDELLTLSELLGTSTRNVNHAMNDVVSEKVRLPKIELPMFNGDYTKWRPFKDLFVEMVHNQQLSGCQKLWYWKSSLTGEASGLIQHLSTTSENYSSAWDIITSRYENKRLIISTILQRLLSQQSSQRDSASSLKTLHDQSRECLLGLQAMGLNIESWDPFSSRNRCVLKLIEPDCARLRLILSVNRLLPLFA